jgi:hypothetical protein
MKSTLLLAVIFLIALTSCKFVNIHLASDIKTGEYLGVVGTEIRDFESKEIVAYEIQTEKGLIRKLPQEIKIYEP